MAQLPNSAGGFPRGTVGSERTATSPSWPGSRRCRRGCAARLMPVWLVFPYAWPRMLILATNVVRTSQPLAAQAGPDARADRRQRGRRRRRHKSITSPWNRCPRSGSDAFQHRLGRAKLHGSNVRRRFTLGVDARARRQRRSCARLNRDGAWCGAACGNCTLWFGRLLIRTLFRARRSRTPHGFLVSPSRAIMGA